MSPAGARGPGALGPRLGPNSQERAETVPAGGGKRARPPARPPRPRRTDVVRREFAVVSVASTPTFGRGDSVHPTGSRRKESEPRAGCPRRRPPARGEDQEIGAVRG